jgi:hypothetical protein
VFLNLKNASEKDARSRRPLKNEKGDRKERKVYLEVAQKLHS